MNVLHIQPIITNAVSHFINIDLTHTQMKGHETPYQISFKEHFSYLTTGVFLKGCAKSSSRIMFPQLECAIYIIPES